MARETGRRGFFKEALNQLMQPVAEFLDDGLSEHVPVEAPGRNLLRPPGALPEAEFLEKCHRCGNCVKNCPANAIFPLEAR
ncbi:MAG: 4Fe-4S binding protein, partial [Candidatus Poribacteria bacterium]|nr:4Fe-4S binding protein [Candidatus Poribacteria bacterium]